MLGNAAFRHLSSEPGIRVYGTVRGAEATALFPPALREAVISGVDVEDYDCLVRAMAHARPTVVINCVGVVKQRSDADDPLVALPLNALLPHRLARLCELAGARFVHVSTDCVFSGRKGSYRQTDVPDAEDLYGRSKLLGEVDYPNAITLRTSIIGRELASRQGLVDWFLTQEGPIKGYRRAIFSGLTTVELSRVVARYVLPNPDMHGLYQVSADPISKHDLLVLAARIFQKKISIEPIDEPAIDRSLLSDEFRRRTGYQPPGWNELLTSLKTFYAA
jgi:dTDP-4-dehydrorhamnose reductase